MKNKKARDFLRVLDFSVEEIKALLTRAIELKKELKAGKENNIAKGKILGLLFEKPSTRTRISFESAMYHLGGNCSFLSTNNLQLKRGEPLKDTARVLSRYLDCLVVRTFGQNIVEELARWSTIPVINGLTDQHHPCQALSDIMTVIEKKTNSIEDLKSLKIAWVGDGNNVAHSWIETCARLDLSLYLACPKGYEPEQNIIQQSLKDSKATIVVGNDPIEAVKDADVINTDVWASMGQEDEANTRKEIFKDYQVNNRLLSYAKKDAIVLHCLPAHRGEEISEEVLEGPQSVVWDQAENKMHLHRALLEFLLN